MSGSGCQVAAMIDRHTESYVPWLREGEGKKKREQSLITLFQGREVLPCISLYMLELHSYKHTHVKKECSLLLSFGPWISYCNRKVIKETTPRFFKLVCITQLELLFKRVIYVSQNFPVTPVFFPLFLAWLFSALTFCTLGVNEYSIKSQCNV